MHVSVLPLAIVLILGQAIAAHADSAMERVAFQFTGPCTAQQRQLLSSLSAMDGIRSVDVTSIPDHALVDIDGRLISADDLASMVRRLMNETTCRAEPMESCISAMPLGHRAEASTDNGHHRSR